MPSRIKLAKNSVFFHTFSKFTGILLFVSKYTYISLLLKMINGFPDKQKTMVSPFKSHTYPYCFSVSMPSLAFALCIIRWKGTLTVLFKLGQTFFSKLHLWGSMTKPGGTRHGLKLIFFWHMKENLKNSLSNVICFMSVAHLILMIWLFCTSHLCRCLKNILTRNKF